MKIEKGDVIIETHYYCPPGLKRTRYFIDSMERKVPDPETPSGLLMHELKERERSASGILHNSGILDRRDLSSDEIIEREEFNTFVEDVEKSEPEHADGKPKRKLRTLKKKIDSKIETLVFDDTAVKQGQLEDEAYDMLNKDGFYDEILPIDYDEDAPDAEKKPIKAVALYTGVLFILVAFLVWYVKFIILR